ncbi:hypothetical protein TNCV_94541 [Trichonephila clavipes]|nr:hypothetical protein TNCV_94541 [Trichonephila clavipes]
MTHTSNERVTETVLFVGMCAQNSNLFPSSRDPTLLYPHLRLPLSCVRQQKETCPNMPITITTATPVNNQRKLCCTLHTEFLSRQPGLCKLGELVSEFEPCVVLRYPTMFVNVILQKQINK